MPDVLAPTHVMVALLVIVIALMHLDMENQNPDSLGLWVDVVVSAFE
jgi:hypothetical protein